MCDAYMSGPAAVPGLFGIWDVKVTADLQDEPVIYLLVEWHGRSAVLRRIAPPGMAAALADEHAAVLLQVAN